MHDENVASRSNGRNVSLRRGCFSNEIGCKIHMALEMCERGYSTGGDSPSNPWFIMTDRIRKIWRADSVHIWSRPLMLCNSSQRMRDLRDWHTLH